MWSSPLVSLAPRRALKTVDALTVKSVAGTHNDLNVRTIMPLDERSTLSVPNIVNSPVNAIVNQAANIGIGERSTTRKSREKDVGTSDKPLLPGMVVGVDVVAKRSQNSSPSTILLETG